MAHFAQISDYNRVINTVVIDNSDCVDGGGNESEETGVSFCKRLFGENTRWVQTSYNGNFRKNYARPGDIYDELRDAFISPKPFNSWVLNETTCKWEPPFPPPDNNRIYFWNEDTISWV